MAMLLQRDYSLPVIAARLTQDASGPIVRLDLVVNEEGRRTVEGSRTVALREFGRQATRTRVADPELAVPQQVTEFITGWARTSLDAGRALWLHLVKPYGLLGAIPWERDLVTELGCPLLRLPDVLPEPSCSVSSLSVAIVATAPALEGPPPGLDLAVPVADALSRGFPGKLHLQVFVDSDAGPAVERGLRQLGLASFRVHTPSVEPAPRPTRPRAPTGTQPGDLRSGWLRWVRDSLVGMPMDAVHFLVHGNSLGTRGAILTPLEATAEREFPVSVEASEIEAFLTQVGALTAGFTRLELNWSDHGLRQLVDELGAGRAGPVLLYDPDADAEEAALAEAYRFLTSPEPSLPPVSPSLALYAQPRQVLQEAPYLAGTGWASKGRSSAVQAQFAKEDTPGWLATAQRYLEQQELAITRFHSESQGRRPSAAEVAHYAGVESAVRKARDVIERHAERLL